MPKVGRALAQHLRDMARPRVQYPCKVCGVQVWECDICQDCRTHQVWLELTSVMRPNGVNCPCTKCKGVEEV